MESMTNRRRSVRGIAGTLAVGLAVGGSLLMTGGAANAAGDGAIVIKDFTCIAAVPGTPVLTSNDKTQAVITPSGNAKLTCHFEGPAVDETVIVDGIPCFTFLGPTTNSHFVYTKSGHGTATCELKHP